MKINKQEIKKLVSEYDLIDGYWITNDGDVYKEGMKDGEKTFKKMSPFITRDGYVEYVLTLKNGKKKHQQAHRLVGLTWLGKPKCKRVMEVDHKDGNRSNNHKDNLRWMSKQNNLKLRDLTKRK